MLNEFITYIESHQLRQNNQPLLVAVSGGVDSVVLLHLVIKANFPCAIAHCNFQLRGDESDDDEKFVRQLAAQYNIPIHVERFDIKSYKKNEKVSTQMAARTLRYAWFEKLIQTYNYSKVCIAHHQNDATETFFINLFRGTGIRGLVGIPVQRDTIIRPLMFATRSQIASYASQNNLQFREDSSNHSGNYQRNLIRHKLIPLLNELAPGSETNILHTIQHLKQVFEVYSHAIKQQIQQITIERGNHVEISNELLLKQPYPNSLLFELLHPYGFNEATCNAIIELIQHKTNNHSGQIFYSEKYQLEVERNHLQLIPNQRLTETEQGLSSTANPPQLILSTHKAEQFVIPNNPNIACFDNELIQFPLSLRRWQPGDAFYPLGMKARKKLSDYFIDTKISLRQKKQLWLLLSGDQIIWIVGQRIDHRFRITTATKTVLQINLK